MGTEDKLFRAMFLILSSQENGLEETIRSLFTSNEFKETFFKAQLVQLIDGIIVSILEQQNSEQTKHIAVLNALLAVFISFDSFEKRLINTWVKILLSLSEEMHFAIFETKLNVFKILNEMHIKKERDGFLILKKCVLLSRAGIFTQEIFEEMSSQTEPLAFLDALILLHQNGLLNTANRLIIRNYPHSCPTNLSEALISLHQANILRPEYSEVLSKHSKPKALVGVLISLHQANLFTPEDLR